MPAWLLAGPRAAQGSVRGGKPVCGWGGLGDVAVPGDGDTEALGHADGSEALVRGSDPDSMCIPPPARMLPPLCLPGCKGSPGAGWVPDVGSGVWGGCREDQGPRRGWRQPGMTEESGAASSSGQPWPPADLRDARRHSPPPFLRRPPPPPGPKPTRQAHPFLPASPEGTRQEPAAASQACASGGHVGVTWELGALSWLAGQAGPGRRWPPLPGWGMSCLSKPTQPHTLHPLTHPALLPKGLKRLPASNPGPGWVTGADRTVSCSGTPGWPHLSVQAGRQGCRPWRACMRVTAWSSAL